MGLTCYFYFGNLINGYTTYCGHGTKEPQNNVERG